MAQNGTRRNRRQRLLPDEGARRGRADRARRRRSAALGSVLSRPASARSKWFFSRATAAAIGYCPSEMNFRANIYGMKQLGVEHLVSVSTAGSMKEEFQPGDLVVPDQFIDHTYKRPATFFGDGIVAHVSLADPVCADLARDLVAAAGEAGATVHRRRHLPVHRGAAVLDPRRIESLPQLGRRRDQHDRDAGGAARARGGDVLRGAGAGDRLRLLARERSRRSISARFCA